MRWECSTGCLMSSWCEAGGSARMRRKGTGGQSQIPAAEFLHIIHPGILPAEVPDRCKMFLFSW